MRGSAPARERLARAGMRRDERGAVKDAHVLGIEDDLDVIAHQSMRHAVAHGVDIDQGIMGDAPAEPLLATR